MFPYSPAYQYKFSETHTPTLWWQKQTRRHLESTQLKWCFQRAAHDQLQVSPLLRHQRGEGNNQCHPTWGTGCPIPSGKSSTGYTNNNITCRAEKNVKVCYKAQKAKLTFGCYYFSFAFPTFLNLGQDHERHWSLTTPFLTPQFALRLVSLTFYGDTSTKHWYFHPRQRREQ